MLRGNEALNLLEKESDADGNVVDKVYKPSLNESNAEEESMLCKAY